MFEISKGIILSTSVLEFLPACWRAMPTLEEFYDIDWREVKISTIYANITHHSYKEKWQVHCESRGGQATRISEPDYVRQELWGSAKANLTTPDQWTHTHGVLNSQSFEYVMQPAVRNSFFGVFFRNGIVHNDASPWAVRALQDHQTRRFISIPLSSIGRISITLRCNQYQERWENGVCKEIRAVDPWLLFYDTTFPRFNQYVPRDDMDWSGFYLTPDLKYPNATDKMVFLAKLKELTEQPKFVIPL